MTATVSSPDAPAISGEGMPLRPLGEVLTRSTDWITLDATEVYTEVTVRLWGKGVIRRGEKLGGEIGGIRRLRVHPREFILSRIDARNGAFGLVPAELDGAVVSNDFPCFRVEESTLLPEYLGWLSWTRWFVEACKQVSEGTTNRVRLNEEKFLAIRIPLPPMDEQRRIVAKIERLAAHASMVTSCIEAQTKALDALCTAIIVQDATTPTPMSDLVQWRKPDIAVEPSVQYRFAGVYCFGRGLFAGEAKLGLDFSYKTLTRLNAGEFVYPKLMAWEGALGVVPPECDGLYVSPEFPVFEIDADQVLPEVLDTYFRTPSVWPSLSGASTGTNVRRRRLNPVDFLKYNFPLPSQAAQKQLREVRMKCDHIKATRKKTATELDALLPSILDKAFKGEL